MGKLARSQNKIFAGVCSGIAEHFHWNTSLTRFAFVILAFMTVFSAVIAYLILWVVMPINNNKKNYQDRMNDRLGRR